VSDRFVDRLLADCRPNTLLVTADQGTCDNARFERLRAERGCEVVVTDHHGVPDEGPPAAALRCWSLHPYPGPRNPIDLLEPALSPVVLRLPFTP
ncbi:MAG: hypothetical protein J0H07_00145, partial [Sphingobacteriales bacterium]|nr:hypothetical protein [Sphingobacteriales bacterium]